MTGKRIGAWAAAVSLVLSLAPVGALAAGTSKFTDIQDHWACADIQAMEERGYANGWPDGKGGYVFDPDRKMSAAETLLFCSRLMGVDMSVQNKVEAARGDEIRQAIPANVAGWSGAVREFAVAVEAGVIGLDELEDMNATDPSSVKRDEEGNIISSTTYLEWRITREDICKYLVRAMQLEPLAKSLTNFSLDKYQDADRIGEELRPYVYVLTNCGVVQGDPSGKFWPRPESSGDTTGYVTRAEMITMLSRALKYMESNGIKAEMGEYTDYPWSAGVVEGKSVLNDGSVALTLRSVLTGEQSKVSVSSGVKIYQDNMLGTTDNLRAGRYVRLNYNSSGKSLEEIRVGGVLTEYEGPIVDLTEGRLTVSIDEKSRAFQLDRFTQVSAGKLVGDRAVIDEQANYTSAHCWVDSMGHLSAVKLLGGTQAAEGLIRSVSVADGTVKLSVSHFSGVAYDYALPDGSLITVDGKLRDITKYEVGKFVRLRVRNEDATIADRAEVDTVTNYVQGPIKKVNLNGAVYSVIIANAFTNKEEAYNLRAGASVVYYDTDGEGQNKALNTIKAGWFVTALVDGEGIITSMEAYPSAVTVSGRLSNIVRGADTILTLTQDDNSELSYALDMNDLPEIYRGGKKATVADLRPGDELVLTLRYNEITEIEATAQSADLTGTITALTRTLTGTTMEVKLSDDTTRTWSIGNAMTVIQNGSVAGTDALRPGQSVALTTEGEKLISIEITGAASTATEVKGKVWQGGSGSSGSLVIIRDDDPDAALTVKVSRDTNLLSADGKALSLSDFTSGSRVTIRGSYSNGDFNATIVILE